MADYPALITSIVAQTQFAGAGANRLKHDADFSTLALTGIEQPSVPGDLVDEDKLPALGMTLGNGSYTQEVDRVSIPVSDWNGYTQQLFGPGDPWFFKIIVSPVEIALGNVLSSQQASIAIYNSFKRTNQTFSSFVNNAGAGITIPDLPSLPTTLLYQNGFDLTVQVSVDGDPIINGTLDFVFNLYTIMVDITGRRVVVFPFSPESPLVERLVCLTDVLETRNGGEQRIKLRKNPRQEFDFRMALDGDQRRKYDALMFDWQSSIFGLPVWPEGTQLSQAATATDTVITVNSTDYADYRVGSLMVVYRDNNTYDALEVASFTSTTITLASPLNNSYPVGTLVMPMRLAVANRTLDGRRAPVNLGTQAITFRVTDNDNSLADTSAFSTLLGKVFLDDPNYLPTGTAVNALVRRLIEQDRNTGVFTQDSPWDRSKRRSTKGFITSSRQQLWELRQLWHALAGRQTSFYIPTFYDELQPSQNLQIAQNDLVVENVGFNQFIQDRKGLFRVVLTDGTVLIRTLTSSAETSATEETLTFVESWSQTYTVSEVDTVQFIELIRFDSDTMELIHANSSGYAGTVLPTVEVFD